MSPDDILRSFEAKWSVRFSTGSRLIVGYHTESQKTYTGYTTLIPAPPDDILRSYEVKRSVCARSWTLFTTLLPVILSLWQMLKYDYFPWTGSWQKKNSNLMSNRFWHPTSQQDDILSSLCSRICAGLNGQFSVCFASSLVRWHNCDVGPN